MIPNTFEAIINFVRESLSIPESVKVDLAPLGVRGSERNFYRVKWGNVDSAILIDYNPERVENTYYADIARFLRGIHVAVPEIYGHNETKCMMIFEDMGDSDLWSFRETPWEYRRTLYQKTLAVMRRIHSYPSGEFPLNQVRLMEGFGPEIYKWEREYFKDNFVSGVCGINLEPSFATELETELAELAKNLSGIEQTLVHRDFQSQNVMIRDGEPFLIDFQGMRFGNPLYDLGSLLCDPYMQFTENEMWELLSFYCVLTSWDMDWDTFLMRFWEASAQRLMQALGAYGFLGKKKGLVRFLEHIPSGLANLQRATTNASSLPRLLEITIECRNILEK